MTKSVLLKAFVEKQGFDYLSVAVGIEETTFTNEFDIPNRPKK
jgi:hypothetical protein